MAILMCGLLLLYFGVKELSHASKMGWRDCSRVAEFESAFEALYQRNDRFRRAMAAAEDAGFAFARLGKRRG